VPVHVEALLLLFSSSETLVLVRDVMPMVLTRWSSYRLAGSLVLGNGVKLAPIADKRVGTRIMLG